ncbi:SDR family NAD(P)-dependent oxidoreductase [Actinoplanes bogorensis]|uniref:SDR family NAD(P)-dependent oxidoreductase n=1 Tax=Paractinoplanes bogorensis TaxID=1610840 RepID=A0ABS5YKA8_9ACTN|nr:SDR family NAD(P)-dependent oxidoreductase [Actinoplanes bogorensis]MBU2663910.1 SDR family NAD(P)-dependent oxidoreductase [Actinoplanes bogorensis]
MTSIAIIGAGPGLGLAVARRFGREGFSVALIARSRDNLDRLTAELRESGVTAAGFTADVRDPASLSNALAQAGPVEVLQYSPRPAREFMLPVLDTTAGDLIGPIETSVYGPVTAVHQVLPGMRALGRGTIVLVNGASAVRPRAAVTGTSVAFAAESAYAEMLHDALRPEGIHVAQVIIPRGIGGGEPSHEPGVLADLVWAQHVGRGEFRTFAAPLD